MDKKILRRKYGISLGMILIIAVLVGIAIMTVRYPRNMKNMFVQSSLDAMENKLNETAVYINDNVNMNYEEMRLLAGLIADKLDGSENYSPEVLMTMQETLKNAGFTNIGIMKENSGHLFATMSDGSVVQLDTWILAIDYGESDVSVELQTSPFQSADDGEDAVVYRYRFVGKDGNSYMLIGEKSQDTLKAMLNVDANEEGLTIVIRNNGNIVYGNGSVESSQISSYNLYAMLQDFGMSEEQIDTVKEQFQENQTGRFQFVINDEPYYFMFHKIENTGWIELNAYSETAMAGKNLSKVNEETIKLVLIVATLLIFALVFSVAGVFSSMKKASEQKALETELLFEEMSSHIPMAFAILAEKSQQPNFISRNFYEVLDEGTFDFSREGIVLWAGIHGEEMEERIRTDKKYETTIYKQNRYFAMGMYPIGFINNKNHYVLIFNDITDDMNSKKLLEASIKRADTASRSKTQFLSKMSHEIRTPLNSVIGFSKLALDGWQNLSREELLDYVEKINISGNYLLDLVSDILDISRIEEGRMEISKLPCSLDSMVNEIVDSFQGQMKRKNLQFVVDKQYEDVILNMDGFHTKQILNNLISNAYKYTEDGGVVGFEISTKKVDERQMALQFVIQDTGIGMSPEFQKKIFEPFTQEDRGVLMKKQLRGSGLGMSICKNLIDLLNGTIKLESEPGEGSCFTVLLTFDLAEEEQAGKQQKNEQKEVDYSCLKGQKILVVDDIEMNRMFIEKVLSNYGMIYEEAEDGQMALEKFEASEEEEYFAIFMDVNMPVMNGHEATERIRKMNRTDAKDIMIAGMTADAFSDDVNKALMCGMNYHISKPIQIDRVLSVLMETYEKKVGKEND